MTVRIWQNTRLSNNWTVFL